MNTKTETIPYPHPGEILKEDFMEPKGLTAYRVAKDMRITQSALAEILSCRRAVTPEMALRIQAYTGISAKVWTGLQAEYDLRKAMKNRAFAAKLKTIPRPSEPAIEVAA